MTKSARQFGLALGNVYWFLCFFQEGLRQSDNLLHFNRLTFHEKFGVFLLLMAPVNAAMFAAYLGAERASKGGHEKVARGLSRLALFLQLTPLFFLLEQPLHQLSLAISGPAGMGRWRNLAPLFALGLTYVIAKNVREFGKVRFAPAASFSIASSGFLVFLAALSIAVWSRNHVPPFNPSLPNILILTPDGVEADHLSLYGYEHDTTPFLRSLSSKGLLVMEAQAVGSGTFSSTAAMLSGRHPVSTGLTWMPAVIKREERGKDFLSLLENAGYSIWYRRGRFTDPTFFGLGSYGMTPWPLFCLREARTFVGHAVDNAEKMVPERLKFLLVANPLFKSLLAEQSYSVGEDLVMANFFTQLEKQRKPFFAHLHLMSTHCCPYASKPGGYDEVIRDADARIEKIFQFLSEKGLAENTIVIVSSDHSSGRVRDNRERVPLFFLFPRGEHSGVVRRLATPMDIAPTILDHLKMEIPSWLSGYSLLRPSEIPRERAVLQVWRHHMASERHNKRKDVSQPFFAIEKFTLSTCGKFFWMNPVTEETGEEPLKRSSKLDCIDPVDRAPTSISERFQREINRYK